MKSALGWCLLWAGSAALAATPIAGGDAAPGGGESDRGADTANRQAHIAALEARFGAYAPGLAEQLLGLGAAYQEQGRHPEAAAALKRATHLSRVNHGLHSAEQIPILRRLIKVLVAAGDYESADQRQHQLYRVQSEVYGPGAPQMSLAMLERARWEEQIYIQSGDPSSFKHLLNMWELYYRAFKDIGEREGSASMQLLEPLNGLLATQYLISVHEGEPGSRNPDERFEFVGGRPKQGVEESRFSMVRASNYRQGRTVLATMRKLHQDNQPPPSALPAESLLDLGDWQMWHQRRESARRSYQRAWDELAAMRAGEELLRRHFGEPLLLPDLPGHNRDLEAPRTIRGHVEVSFTVSARGRVNDLRTLAVELAEGDGEGASPSRLLRSLHGKIWRPRYQAREPVATENMVRRYAF